MLCEQALREIKGDACPNCTQHFNRSADVVFLNPPDNILQERKEALITARQQQPLYPVALELSQHLSLRTQLSNT